MVSGTVLLAVCWRRLCACVSWRPHHAVPAVRYYLLLPSHLPAVAFLPSPCSFYGTFFVLSSQHIHVRMVGVPACFRCIPYPTAGGLLRYVHRVTLVLRLERGALRTPWQDMVAAGLPGIFHAADVRATFACGRGFSRRCRIPYSLLFRAHFFTFILCHFIPVGFFPSYYESLCLFIMYMAIY